MKGFTLLEVMIALAIMAGVVLTVITSFNYNLSVATRDREETVAMLLARAKLDDPRLREQETKNGTFAPEWPGYGWVLDVAPTQLPLLDKMTLTVSWDNARRNLSLVQYVAK
ncbi:type II secretion system minor pseudopilin GspI [Geobacter sp. DSM 9736]|uniref:type II secretion system minor pseudopilin GspI n=1 Tax=Geobacter sp. DSM 9736 TaxID=1277350 RepID=UPI000B50E4FD|nr:type II secretion system minor pseudopilin GspI [Geobacter sp. DSM 9736]SNB47416.1 type II secretion system protein I (GspI) [Geobacter sp. DSM 9736]